MPDNQVILVPGLKTIGPYSQAARAAGLLFVSGQPGTNPSTGEAAGLTFNVQARQVFKNLDIVLRAGGSRLELVVNTTGFLTDISNFSELNQLFTEFFPTDQSYRIHLPQLLLTGDYTHNPSHTVSQARTPKPTRIPAQHIPFQRPSQPGV